MRKTIKDRTNEFKIKRAVDIFMKTDNIQLLSELITKYSVAANYVIEKHEYLDFNMMRNTCVYNSLTNENKDRYINLMLSFDAGVQLSDVLLSFILDNESELTTEITQELILKLFKCRCRYNNIYCYNKIKMNKYFITYLIDKDIKEAEEAYDYFANAYNIMDDELKAKIEKNLIENATTYYLKRYVRQYNIINLKLLIKKALEFNNAELYYNILENLQLYNSLDDRLKKELIKKIIATGDKEFILKTAIDIDNSLLDNFTASEFMGAINSLELDEEDTIQMLLSAHNNLAVHNKNKYIDETIKSNTKNLKK